MDIEEMLKPELPKPPPPVESESEFHYEPIFDEEKHKRKIRLLVILAILVIVLAAGLIIGKHYNFYTRRMKALRFDYTGGETVDKNTTIENPGHFSKALAEQYPDGKISVQTDQVLFHSDMTISKSLISYDYRSDNGTEEADFRCGMEGLIFSKSGKLRRTGSLLEQKGFGDWTSETTEQLPALYPLLFAAEGSGKYEMEFYDSYYSTVGPEKYTCELWLMTAHEGSLTKYFTIYRYFTQDGTLAAARVLQDHQELMQVYDIKSYAMP